MAGNRLGVQDVWSFLEIFYLLSARHILLLNALSENSI